MKIIAFYSFKGGVGRTSALLNVGYLLAVEERANVVLADWDIHAPGLTCLEDLQPDDGAPPLRPGVVDVLASLAEATPESDVLDPGGLVHSTRVGRRIAAKSGGELWLVPAGAFDPTEEQAAYLETVRRLQPQIQDLAKAGREDLVAWFGERVAKGFREKTGKDLDYLLLDARTGLTEVGDLLLSDATDQVVVLFGLNKQNLLGMEQTLRQLVERFGAANVASRVVLVASPVPAGEEALKARRLAVTQETITRIVDELTRKASEGDPNPIVPAAPRLLRIPYHPLLALEEAMIAEDYPESDPGRAYVALKSAVQIGHAGDIATPRAIVTTAVERLQEKPVVPSKEGVRGENPLARPLRWNVVNPSATADSFARNVPEALREPLLQGLANFVDLKGNDLGNILDALPTITGAQAYNLVRTLQEAQRRWRALGTDHWEWLADQAGRSWAKWAFLSGGRFGTTREHAVRRLFEDWPCRLEGKVGTRAAIAAIDEVVTQGVNSPDTYRPFTSRLIRANPDIDLALGATAALLLELGDNDASKALFEKASSIPPSETALTLAHHLHNAGTRLLPTRPLEALVLLEEAGMHYSRALAIKPDLHGAENNWGITLGNRASALAPQNLEKALNLWEQSYQHFARALAIKPDQPEAEYNWGLALNNQARALAPQNLEKALTLWAQAYEHSARALAIKPDKPEAENNWGNALDNQARALAPQNLEKALALWEQAYQHYARALAIKPDMPEAEYNWGNALVNQSEALVPRDTINALTLLEQAAQHLERALTLKPGYHTPLDGLTTCELHRYYALLHEGRHAEAQAAAARALHFAEKFRAVSGEPSYNLACALSINGRIDEALDLLESLQRSGSLDVDANHLTSDPDLRPLAEHPRFKALLEHLAQARKQ
ncbi:MAG TPA: hypothetical protein VE093_15185 [Polyangiaceae bacterium]|nr:hypothetical protein [Polyangiaceae bacterium]